MKMLPMGELIALCLSVFLSVWLSLSLPLSLFILYCPSVNESDFVRTIPPESLNHLKPNLVWLSIIMRRSVMQKKYYLQCQGHSEGLYIQNMTISTISSKLVSFATSHRLVVLHHKSECPVEKLDYCIQGQGQSRHSKCQCMFVPMVSSEPQNILLPSWMWWCSIISQSVLWKIGLLQSRSRSQ